MSQKKLHRLKLAKLAVLVFIILIILPAFYIIKKQDVKIESTKAIKEFSYKKDENKYVNDFNYLSKIVKETHPKAYNNKGVWDSLTQVFNKQVLLCNNDNDFAIVAQKYMSHLHDGHSSIQGIDYRNNGFFPVQFKHRNNQIFLANYPEGIDTKYIGSKIDAINGICMDTLFRRSEKIISADNQVGLANYLGYYLKYSDFLKQLGADNNFTYNLSLAEYPGMEFKMVVDTAKNGFFCTIDKAQHFFELGEYNYYKKQKHNYTGWNNNLFHYKIFEKQNTCYFHYQECRDLQYLKTMKGIIKPYWLYNLGWRSRGGNFSKFLVEMFREIDENQIDNLVIDLRENSGGTSILGLQLLDYLADVESLKHFKDGFLVSELFKQNYPKHYKEVIDDYSKIYNYDSSKLPFYIPVDDKFWANETVASYLRDKESVYYQEEPLKKFKGKIYVLIGKYTFSSTAMLAIEMADNNLATLVGEPIKQSPSHYGEVLEFTLPKTGVKGNISCKRFYRPDLNKDSENTLNPDYYMVNSVKNEFEGKDAVFDYVFTDLIGTTVPE